MLVRIGFKDGRVLAFHRVKVTSIFMHPNGSSSPEIMIHFEDDRASEYINLSEIVWINNFLISLA